jgi:hypothetical protein
MTMTSDMLLVVFMLASLAMFSCAVAEYFDTWRPDRQGAQGGEAAKASLLRSDWFFYFNALLSFMSMFGLSMLI